MIDRHIINIYQCLNVFLWKSDDTVQKYQEPLFKMYIRRGVQCVIFPFLEGVILAIQLEISMTSITKFFELLI